MLNFAKSILMKKPTIYIMDVYSFLFLVELFILKNNHNKHYNK